MNGDTVQEQDATSTTSTTSTTVDGRPRAPRLGSLDGLRGLAAVVVLLHHAMLVSPGLATANLAEDPPAGVAAALAHSPLHLAWAGTEAVYLFFVLSGYVLTRWWLSDGPRLPAYYRRRLLRLYLPVWAALGLSAVLVLLVPRTHVEGQSFWIAGQTISYGWSSLWGDLTLGAPSNLDNPLWSLRFEVLFSLLLPVYAAVARRASPLWLPLTALAVLASTLGVLAHSRLGVFMPMFAIGSMLAVRPRADGVVDLKGSAWWGLATTAALLITATWWLPLPQAAAIGSTLTGAALLIWVFVSCATLRTWGSTPVASWLGSRSFSLYLTHVPILATVAFAFPTGPREVVAVVGLALALPVAEAFHRWVEAPCHAFANTGHFSRTHSRAPVRCDGDPAES